MERTFTQRLDGLFQSIIEVPRVKLGKRQEVETLITEALLLAEYWRGEKHD